MVDGYKVVVNTAAGRRRYMQYLIPQVVTCEIIDRYDIWINTNDKIDIAFFLRCAEHFPKINLVYQPDGIVTGIRSINAFYKACQEENTIYLKLDDDIVWLEPDFFEKMIRFRINNPEYFVISPLVINNAICTYILQVEGKIKLKKYVKSLASHKILWRSGKFASELHEWFMPMLQDGNYTKLYCGAKPIALTRFSINSICWFGRDFTKWEGVVQGDDEEFLSNIYPTMNGRSNCFNTNCIIVHFAFYTQRKLLDKKNILGRYGIILTKFWSEDEKMRKINDCTQEAMNYVEVNKEEILKREHMYTLLPKAKKGYKYYINKIKLFRRSWISAK